jgi:hypothetical protein
MSQQTYDLTAPPRDPTEVLIEEVRQQTRRRRRRNLALVIFVVATGLSIYVGTSGDSSAPPAGPGARTTSASPPAVTSAIKKTLSVQSIEVFTSYEPGPGIYQAPDLYAFPIHAGKTTIAATFISADTEYRTNAVSTDHVRLLRVETSSPLQEKSGLSPAQQSAFGPLVYFEPLGTEFDRTAAGTYTFHLALTTGGRDEKVRYTGGEITLARGYVASVRIDTVTTVKAAAAGTTGSRSFSGTTVVDYKRIDDNPRLLAPRPNTAMCLPPGSLILQNC